MWTTQSERNTAFQLNSREGNLMKEKTVDTESNSNGNERSRCTVLQEQSNVLIGMNRQNHRALLRCALGRSLPNAVCRRFLQ